MNVIFNKLLREFSKYWSLFFLYLLTQLPRKSLTLRWLLDSRFLPNFSSFSFPDRDIRFGSDRRLENDRIGDDFFVLHVVTKPNVELAYACARRQERRAYWLRAWKERENTSHQRNSVNPALTRSKSRSEQF